MFFWPLIALVFKTKIYQPNAKMGLGRQRVTGNEIADIYSKEAETKSSSKEGHKAKGRSSTSFAKMQAAEKSGRQLKDCRTSKILKDTDYGGNGKGRCPEGRNVNIELVLASWSFLFYYSFLFCRSLPERYNLSLPVLFGVFRGAQVSNKILLHAARRAMHGGCLKSEQ